MDRTIGIGQGAGDEDLAWLGHGARLLDETEVGHYKALAHIFHPVSLFHWMSNLQRYVLPANAALCRSKLAPGGVPTMVVNDNACLLVKRGAL
jgi:hypothetical protein